jgi:putative membrane protein
MSGLGWCGGEMGVAGWLLMGLAWGAFLAVVVWAVLRLFPSGGRDRGEHRPPGGDPAGDLDRRLAAGEIDADDYLRQRDALTGTR